MNHQVIITAQQFEELKKQHKPIKKVIQFRKFWRKNLDEIAKKSAEWRNAILKMESLALLGGKTTFFFWVWEVLIRPDGAIALLGLKFPEMPVFDDLMSIREKREPGLITIGNHEINKVLEKVTTRRKLEEAMWNETTVGS